MARHALKFALHTIALAVVSGCTQLTVNPGEAPNAFEQPATPSSAMESAAAEGTYASQNAPAPVAAVAAPAPVAASTQAASSVQQEDECAPTNADNKRFFRDKERKLEVIKVNVTGYGAPPKSFYPEPQRRLMAMRAAKLDAYRSLAERVNGLRIWGGTTIGDMIVEKDRYRVFLDAFVRGAKVIVENSMDDGTYETVVELSVGQEFLDRALKDAPPTAPVNDPCAEQGRGSVATVLPAPPMMPSTIAATTQAPTRSSSPHPETPDSSFYFADDRF